MADGLLLTVAYDGTHFAGFAPQKSLRTVHGVLCAALTKHDPGASRIVGASRTDAGVHALGQLVGVDASLHMPARAWVLGVNVHLPEDVAIRSARRVPRGTDPRDVARGKRYRYRIFCDLIRDPQHATRSLRVDTPLDIAAMQQEASQLLGTHDFKAFRTASDPRTETIRTIWRLDVAPQPDARFIDIVVEGDRFLHNMVRIIVGTLVDVGRPGRPRRRGALQRALLSGQRSDLGPTAPAHGLTLEEVFIATNLSTTPEDGDESWP